MGLYLTTRPLNGKHDTTKFRRVPCEATISYGCLQLGHFPGRTIYSGPSERAAGADMPKANPKDVAITATGFVVGQGLLAVLAPKLTAVHRDLTPRRLIGGKFSISSTRRSATHSIFISITSTEQLASPPPYIHNLSISVSLSARGHSFSTTPSLLAEDHRQSLQSVCAFNSHLLLCNLVCNNLFNMTDTKQGGNGPSSAVVESIAGLSAGTLANLVGHPFEIVKTRLQSEYPRDRGNVNLVRADRDN